MKINYNNISPSEAVALQKTLREQIKLTALPGPINTIAGADISFNKYSTTIYAGIIVFSFPSLQVIEKASVVATTEFPYISGLLAFREVPALIEAWEQLQTKPDVLILDGHGIAHPRRMGIATHFGVVMQTPTLGCAKSLLAGHYDEPLNTPPAQSDLVHHDEIIGKVLRTKRNCKPVFISPGNLITMDECLSIILQCMRKYRIPEPTRLAHNYVNEVRIAAGKANSIF